MTNKKGELTSNQLITIIILIISFAIIVAFFVMLNLRQTIDKESCRNSIIMRGAVPGLFKGIVSLRCKTQNVCFSMGGDCAVEDYAKDLSKVKVEGDLDLFSQMSGLMYDCWWMMGEGKVDYGSEYCAVCYNVYFDDKIKERFPKGILYSEVYSSMTEKIPETGKSYLYTIYNLVSLESLRYKISESNGIDINLDRINVNDHYTVVTSMKNPPIYIKFSSAELISKAKCSNFITEV